MTRSQLATGDAEEAARLNAGRYLTGTPPQLSTLRCLLEQYSGILPEAVNSHITEIRERAWAVFPYGAIGSFEFLDMDPTIHDPAFASVAERLRASENTDVFLDVGCCLGQIIRYLVAQGVSGERLFGTDLQSRFIDLGYDLFRDKKFITAEFVCGDMLDDDARLEQLNGKVDIIYAESFFHLFEYYDQKKAAKRMVGFFKKDSRDPIIFGRNGGKKIPGWEKYILDGDGFGRLWQEVGQETATSWSTETSVKEGDDWIQVKFVVRRS